MLLLLFVELNGKSQESKRICPRAWRFRSSLLVPETTITRRAANLARKGGQRGFQSSGGARKGPRAGSRDVCFPPLALRFFFFFALPPKKKLNSISFPPKNPLTTAPAMRAGRATTAERRPATAVGRTAATREARAKAIVSIRGGERGEGRVD